jgi:hypothetical protein
VDSPEFFFTECLFENCRASPLSILSSVATMVVSFPPLEKLPKGFAIAAKSRFQREKRWKKEGWWGGAMLK